MENEGGCGHVPSQVAVPGNGQPECCVPLLAGHLEDAFVQILVPEAQPLRADFLDCGTWRGELAGQSIFDLELLEEIEAIRRAEAGRHLPRDPAAPGFHP